MYGRSKGRGKNNEITKDAMSINLKKVARGYCIKLTFCSNGPTFVMHKDGAAVIKL